MIDKTEKMVDKTIKTETERERVHICERIVCYCYYHH